MEKLTSRATAIADRASAPIIAIMSAVHITVLVVTLILAFMVSAKAQETALCSGENLMGEMAKTNPAKLAEIEAKAAKVPFGNGLLFKLEKNGQAPSYLFGTMHLTDPRVLTMPDAAQKALDAASIVAIESTEVLDPAKAQMALLANPELTMFTDEQRLSDFLDGADKEKLKAGLASRGIQLALVEKMKPWMLTGMLALPQCEFARKQAGESFLDLAIAENAQSNGIELVGLETFAEQFNAMASLPIKLHVQGLVETVSLGDKVNDVTETMIVLYSQGKTGTIWPMLNAVAEEAGSSDAQEGYADFEEKMITTRNKTMIERSLPILEKGNVFVAVGALHLPGENGLAHLFKQAGYTVTAVQ